MQQYIIYAWDGTDDQVLERRMQTRPLHFGKARWLKEKGHFIMGGAMLDEAGNMKGSMMVVQFDTAEQLQDWLDTEPYLLNKVWQKIEVHPFRIADV